MYELIFLLLPVYFRLVPTVSLAFLSVSVFLCMCVVTLSLLLTHTHTHTVTVLGEVTVFLLPLHSN